MAVMVVAYTVMARMVSAYVVMAYVGARLDHVPHRRAPHYVLELLVLVEECRRVAHAVAGGVHVAVRKHHRHLPIRAGYGRAGTRDDRLEGRGRPFWAPAPPRAPRDGHAVGDAETPKNSCGL